MIEKLTVKDLINIGIFSAMYIVTMMVIVTVFGSVPILYLIVPLPVGGIGCAVVYSLLVMRVPKKGAVLLLSILLSVMFVATNWIAVPYSIFCGLIAEWLLSAFGRTSEKGGIRVSFLAMSCSTVGPFLSIIFMKDKFIQTCAEYYGAQYAQTLSDMTPPWLILPLIILAIVGGIIGNAFTKKSPWKAF